jgi:hypothetical protein
LPAWRCREHEKLALVAFVPYNVDFLLKARSRMKAESSARCSRRSLKKPYEKYYGLPTSHRCHLKAEGEGYERDIVLFATRLRLPAWIGMLFYSDGVELCE